MAEQLKKIQRFVVLIIENRSFDHLLGYLKIVNPRVVGLTRTEYSNYPDPSTKQQPPVSVSPPPHPCAAQNPDNLMKTLRRNLATMLATVMLLFAANSGVGNAGELPHLYVPDGQLLSRPIQVYVAYTNLNNTMKPTLQLFDYDAQGKQEPAQSKWTSSFVAGGQSWMEDGSGVATSYQGTFLMFDLHQYKKGNYGSLKSAVRVTPVLTWTDPSATNAASLSTVVGNTIYLGDRRMAAVWTTLVIGAIIALICQLCRFKSAEKVHLKGVLSLISGPDNYMSLWRTQLVAWTLAVGYMVFFFGIIQLEVPQIPDSLVALMGMSVITGGLSAIAAKSQPKPSNNPLQKELPINNPAGDNPLPNNPQPNKADPNNLPQVEDNGPDKDHEPKVSDLITSYNPDLKIVVLSVPKAQMLFWTGIILILFVAKSLLTGELWNVPWEMVALTGVSQAGYVSDKAINGTS